MGKIEKVLRENVSQDVYIHSIRIGNNVEEDVWFSYFKNINEQINITCAALMKDGNLTDGFNAIGFSQGSIFLRGLLQRCPALKMKNLISIGGMHQVCIYCTGTGVY